MVKKEEVLEELINRGYEVELKSTYKGEGISFDTGCDMRPILYTEPFLEYANSNKMDLERTVDLFIRSMEEAKANCTPIDVKEIINVEYMADNLKLAIVKLTETDEFVNKKLDIFGGVTCYPYIKIPLETPGNYGNIKITDAIIRESGMEESEIWKMANINTFEDVKFYSLKGIYEELGHKEAFQELDDEIVAQADDFIILSNSSRTLGASACLHENAIKQYIKDKGWDACWVIPSSIHECILINDDEQAERKLTSIIECVNEEEIEENEVLAFEPMRIEV